MHCLEFGDCKFLNMTLIFISLKHLKYGLNVRFDTNAFSNKISVIRNRYFLKLLIEMEFLSLALSLCTFVL